MPHRGALEIGTRVYLRTLSAADEREMLALHARSRRYLLPWVQPMTTSQQFSAHLARIISDPRTVGCLVCRKEDDAIAGVINISEIVRGLFQSAYLGYYGSFEHRGRGYMTEGLCLVLRHAFLKLKLHRVEANIQPQNERSIRLVKRCGFRYEGFSPRYLKIGGKWRDHERWALLIEEWRANRGRSVSRPPSGRH
jgi:ribosomal-protein-alanine N-acetyltransferase